MKKVIIFSVSITVLLLLLLGSINAWASDPVGDEKIRDTEERIKEEKEKAQKEEAEEEYQEEDSYEDEDESEFLNIIFDALFKELFYAIFEEYLFLLRFSSYPYKNEPAYRFNTTAYFDPDWSRKVAFNLSNDFTVHLDETYGNAARFTFNATAFHANILHHIIFAETESLSLFTLNGGLTFHFPNTLLNGYVGLLYQDTLGELLLSFGTSIQIYLPARLYLDIYNINAKYHSLWFNHLSGDVNFALNRFTLGIGYTFSSYAGFSYHGPSLKAGIWF
jgi:hypothetical protein